MSRAVRRRRVAAGEPADAEPTDPAGRLSKAAFEARRAAFDACVEQTPHIDRFCSASTWLLPASEHLMPRREPYLFETDAGFIALMRGVHAQGWRYLEPLEAMWCLGCPAVGADGVALARDLQHVARAHEREWDLMLLPGLPKHAPQLIATAEQMSRRWAIAVGPPTVRHTACLDGGVDGYLSRRSRGVRKSLRVAERRARSAGVSFEACHPGEGGDIEALYRRILEVERRSWKGRAQDGLTLPGMRGFYRGMAPRLAARGALRLWFARVDDRDVAYVLGGVCGDTYRGLQFSFDDDYRAIGLGNLCQLRQIEALCAEGLRVYDLGTATGGGYKHRWAETTITTEALVIHR